MGKFGLSLTSAPPACRGRRGGEDDLLRTGRPALGQVRQKDDLPAKLSSGWCLEGLLCPCLVSGSPDQGPLPDVGRGSGGQCDVFCFGLLGRCAGGALITQGLPEEIPDRLLGSLAHYAKRPGPSSDTVRQMLGRPALTFARWAADYAAAFQN
jgi:hypothetical protein